MAKFAKEPITSLTQAANHARGDKVKGMRVTAVEVPFDEAPNGHLSPEGRGRTASKMISG
jgi:hypothetical protein